MLLSSQSMQNSPFQSFSTCAAFWQGYVILTRSEITRIVNEVTGYARAVAGVDLWSVAFYRSAKACHAAGHEVASASIH